MFVKSQYAIYILPCYLLTFFLLGINLFWALREKTKALHKIRTQLKHQPDTDKRL